VATRGVATVSALDPPLCPGIASAESNGDATQRLREQPPTISIAQLLDLLIVPPPPALSDMIMNKMGAV
jgi:hypothetical protein